MNSVLVLLGSRTGRVGTPLSIDVSCPSCGHINVDKKKIFCEKCPADLSQLFQQCQHCGKSIRKDIAICPICGFRVIEKLIYDERKKKINFLKEEDIDEAIEILELMIRPGGFASNEDFDLIRELRKKQSKIIPLRIKANKAFSNGNIEKAIGSWEKILRITPIDKKAKFTLQDLKERAECYQLYKNTGLEKILEAAFNDAIDSFKKCESIIPNRSETSELIANCEQNIEKFNNITNNFEKAYKDKLLNKSLNCIDTGLKVYCYSQQLKQAKQKVLKEIEKVNNIFERAPAALISADFNSVEQILIQIKELQCDNIDVEKFIKEYQEIKIKYLNEFQQSIDAKNNRVLLIAKVHANSAVNLCHNSTECKQIIVQINNDIEKVTSLLKSCNKLLAYAAFNEIQEAFCQIEEIQLDHLEYESFKKKYKEVETEYSNKFEQSIKAKKDLDLSKAKEYAILALNICKNSRKCRQLLKEIDRDQKKVILLLDSAETFINQALFDNALEKINQIHKIWINNKEAILLSEKVERIQSDYENYISNIHKSINQGDILKALEYIDSVKNICPNSIEIDDLRTTVNDRKKMVAELLEEARRIVLAANFDQALQKLELAKRIWMDYDKIEKQKNCLYKIKNSYEQTILNAKKNMNWWGYQKAKNFCHCACKLCPRSIQSKVLLETINKKLANKDVVEIIISIIFLLMVSILIIIFIVIPIFRWIFSLF